MNLVIIDLETSGLDPLVHEILEIGAVRAADGAEFEVKVWPLRKVDPEAAKVNGYTPEKWREEAFLLPQALKLLAEFVGTDAYMTAYNVSFDRPFLEKAYRDCNLPYPFHYRHLDLMTLAWAKSIFGLPPSLKEACDIFNVPPESEVHRALNGAQCAHGLYQKFNQK